MPTGNAVAVANDWSPAVQTYARGPLRNAFSRVAMEVSYANSPEAVDAMQTLGQELDKMVSMLPAAMAQGSSAPAKKQAYKALDAAIAVTQAQHIPGATQALFNLYTAMNDNNIRRSQ